MEMNKISLEILNNLRIHDNSDIPDQEYVVTISNAPVAAKGDISVIGGKEKAGKTSVGIIVIATSLMKKIPPDLDTLSIRATYAGNKDVVYIDTEQSKSSTKRFVQNVKRFLGSEDLPPNFYAYNIRSLYKSEDKKEALLKLFEKHQDAHLWVIDGIADFVADPNLPEPSNELIALLMSTAEKHNTCIISFVHENPGLSTKFRGNLGSELQRKCFGAVGIKKDKDKKVHSLEARLLRCSGDFDEIYFRYDKEKGRMVSLNNQESEEYKQDKNGEKKKRELRYKLADQCLLGGSERIGYKEFTRRIFNHALSIEGKKISETTAKNRLKEMIGYEIIEKDNKNKYRLIPKKEETTSAGRKS